MADWNYRWTARLLAHLGVFDLGTLDSLVSGYDDHEISIKIFGSRQGQLSRFEYVLLAALGETFIEKYPATNEAYREWITKGHQARLNKLREVGIPIGKNRDVLVDDENGENPL
jgi:hypothetical protein